MATPSKSNVPQSRGKTVLIGVLLGFAWGSIMWLLSAALGKNSGLAGWLYLALSIAMIGGGVAAVFGAVGAKRSGERVTPRFWRR